MDELGPKPRKVEQVKSILGKIMEKKDGESE